MKNSLTHRWFISPFQKFFHLESSSGLLLLLATLFALGWANSPWGNTYHDVWNTPVSLNFWEFGFSQPLHFWINDGLMAIFFLLVGLEIKRELLVGELSDFKQASLPFMAALGGMLIPALLYLSIHPPGSAYFMGWGIPTVTDIAFSLGVLALCGSGIPLFLKVFLTALAIVDDIGAVLIIALFYSHDLQLLYVGLLLGVWALLFMLNRWAVRRLFPYLLGGLLLWLACLWAGVHTTLAGVMLAMALPSALGETLETRIHPWVSYGVVPLFALANAGLRMDVSQVFTAFFHPLWLAVVVGLVLGKPIGITLFSWLALRLKWATLPEGISLGAIWAVGCLGGIGFTMSLFIANLAFGDSSVLELTKLGILVASIISGLLGWLWLKRVSCS